MTSIHVAPINYTKPVRYVRIEPTAYDLYPKIRVDLGMKMHMGILQTGLQKRFNVYGGLIDGPDKRVHPVRILSVGELCWLLGLSR